MRSLIRLIRSTLDHPLNRSSPTTRIRALGRMLRWQLASRLLPEAAIALPFVRGSCLVASRGMVGVTGNWYSGLDEPNEMGLLLHLLKPGDVFVDIGANVGSFTILAASTGDVSCVAFEPVPQTFGSLARNVAFNAMSDCVRLCQNGVSDQPGVLRFTQALDSMNHVVPDEWEGDGGSVAVEVVRLDDVDLPRPDHRTIFKIDVEGFEMSVLKGASRTMGAPNALCVIMETNGSGERYGVSDAELIAVMAEYGFRPYSYSPFQRKFEPIRSDSIPLNTVFLKDLEEAEIRVAEAPKVSLLNGPL